jgi:hypothetical protein
VRELSAHAARLSQVTKTAGEERKVRKKLFNTPPRAAGDQLHAPNIVLSKLPVLTRAQGTKMAATDNMRWLQGIGNVCVLKE